MGLISATTTKTNKLQVPHDQKLLVVDTTHGSAWVMFRVQLWFNLLHLISMWRHKVCTLHDYTKPEVFNMLSGLRIFTATIL